MTPVEQKEIRGVTVKQGWIFLIGVISIVGSIVGTYFNIINKLDTMYRENKVTLIQIDTNHKKIERLDDDIRTLQMRITVLETKINK